MILQLRPALVPEVAHGGLEVGDNASGGTRPGTIMTLCHKSKSESLLFSIAGATFSVVILIIKKL